MWIGGPDWRCSSISCAKTFAQPKQGLEFVAAPQRTVSERAERDAPGFGAIALADDRQTIL
jgi:hypothetical protein